MNDYRQGLEQDGILTYQPEGDDWRVVEGNPEQFIRIDNGTFEAGPVTGIWKCTPGIIEFDSLAYNEFVNVYEGVIAVRLNDGEETVLKPGDSYFIPKGAKVRYDVRKTVSKYLIVCGDGPVV